jgi:RimJ/RimL family protein N-acetyltransferase
LLEPTIAAAFAFGLTRIELQVRQDNPSAIALYKKFGFEVEGLQRNGMWLDGRYEQLYAMALLRDVEPSSVMAAIRRESSE